MSVARLSVTRLNVLPTMAQASVLHRRRSRSLRGRRRRGDEITGYSVDGHRVGLHQVADPPRDSVPDLVDPGGIRARVQNVVVIDVELVHPLGHCGYASGRASAR